MDLKDFPDLTIYNDPKEKTRVMTIRIQADVDRQLQFIMDSLGGGITQSQVIRSAIHRWANQMKYRGQKHED